MSHKKEEKNYFIFSQVALQQSIPSKLLIYHASTPNTQFTNIKNKDFIFNSNDLQEVKEELPEIFTGTIENLNSKWVMHKKSKWVNMVYLKNKSYNIDFIKDFYLWLAKILNITQTNLSAMENGRRAIGKELAKRLAETFEIDYRIFL